MANDKTKRAARERNQVPAGEQYEAPVVAQKRGPTGDEPLENVEAAGATRAKLADDLPTLLRNCFLSPSESLSDVQPSGSARHRSRKPQV